MSRAVSYPWPWPNPRRCGAVGVAFGTRRCLSWALLPHPEREQGQRTFCLQLFNLLTLNWKEGGKEKETRPRTFFLMTFLMQ